MGRSRRRASVSRRVRSLLAETRPAFWGQSSRKALDLVHPFPAPMPLALAYSIIDATTDPDSTILDPMAGSGTVLVAARRLGRSCYSFDLDPLALLMLRVVSRTHNLRKIQTAAECVFKSAKLVSKDRKHTERLFNQRFDEETKDFIHFWFPMKSIRGLLALRWAIERVKEKGIRDVLSLAFSRVIIAKAAGVSRAIDLPHTRPHRKPGKDVPDPIEVFPKKMKKLYNRLKNLSDRPECPLYIREEDARRLPLEDSSVDLVLTSSPYANAIDYIRAHKFSLVWMGYSISELRAIRARLIGAERVEPKIQADLKWVERYLPHIEGSQERRRGMLRRYFYDMDLVIAELKRVLRPGGACVLILGRSTVGDQVVDTPSIVVKLAERHGLQHLGTRFRRVNPFKRSLPFPSSRRLASPLGRRIDQEAILALSRG